MSKLKKPLFIFFSIIVILAVIVILFVSPIAKYAVQKYDEKYLGRKITMDWAYVNPFTGYVHISNLKIYEPKNPCMEQAEDSIFLSAKGVSANMAMFKLFSKTYEISEITLDHPRGIIIQNKKVFNFNDLIERFTPKEKRDITKAPVRFSILSFRIIDGEFHYREEVIPVNYFIKEVNIVSTGIRWDADTTSAQFSLLPGSGSGDVKGDYTINLKNNDFRFAVVTRKFDLDFIQQYLNDLTNYGSFRANLDMDVKASGNFSDQENLTASGQLALNEFHFGKNPEEDYAFFDSLVLAITELSPEHHKYVFDSISLSRPYFKYERYDYLDNLQTMFGKGGANIDAAAGDDRFNLVIEIARYVKVLAKNFIRSDYNIGRLAIYEGDVTFNDFSISEKFSVELNPFTIEADSIDKNNSRVNISLVSGLKPYGNVSVALSINPNDSSDFDLQYNFKKIPVSMFNPYIVSYTSFPLDRGTLEFEGTWKVRNGMIQSDNHLLIIDPRVTDRLKNKDNQWIPVPLIMALIRERGNVIDYHIPITGNLNDPKFHVSDVLFDLLGNIFVKPATTSYIMQVKNVETEIEKSLAMKWEMRQTSLTPDQAKFTEMMADFLLKNSDAVITIQPRQYAMKEKEYILFFEAKKKYFLLTNNKNNQTLSESDSMKVAKMSVKDSLFVHYLNTQFNDSMLFTIQQKCSLFVDSATVSAQFERLNSKRENAFLSDFKKAGVEKQVKIATVENLIPYNGFSFYKIEYKGEFPESLQEAYREMNKLNKEVPRKKYLQERKENVSVL